MDRMHHEALEVLVNDKYFRIDPKLVREEFPKVHRVEFARSIVLGHTLGSVCVGERNTLSAQREFSDHQYRSLQQKLAKLALHWRIR